MPAGKYSLYLYNDDSRDIQARATIERVSQPLRGEFLRTVAISGGILYRIDVRLPAMLTSLYLEQLCPETFMGVLALLSGSEYLQGRGEGKQLPWVQGKYTGTQERRRFNLILNEGEDADRFTALLDDASSRQRGTLLRELVIAGCVLHEFDNRFPRLISSLPVPPGTLAELQELAAELSGHAIAPNQPMPAEPTPVIRDEVPSSGTEVTRNNMKKMF
ncbi:plasmid partitioning/stability family protein [Cedecea sp. P7760]|uniref:plasmid partitioning/stability family protein n=1 Tax=Cedecea sp. P7760 TaxID=2726983 RepID=UPI0015A2C2C1|nr:ABC transporter [Cedecea sp. P7760]